MIEIGKPLSVIDTIQEKFSSTDVDNRYIRGNCGEKYEDVTLEIWNVCKDKNLYEYIKDKNVTVVLDFADRFFTNIKDFTDMRMSETNRIYLPVMFITHGNLAGFVPHADDHSGEVYQLLGSKKWTFPNSERKNVILVQGDSISFSKDEVHLVEPIEEWSIHLVLGYLDETT
ncbi:hypothetical protein [Vibrio penaeicida]|uniref:hypothetical protein n=1 Tax=Vibrio penaeicida TaxID=104609 RepID=UPI000CE9C575|nr:hypothetical protein [Vibrio penaeicida]